MSMVTRRTRLLFLRTAAVLSLALWLFMAAAEIYSPLHAWLHGGSVPDDDNCAVVLLTHGKVEITTPAAPAVVPTIWIEVTPQIESSVFSTAIAFLPDG